MELLRALSQRQHERGFLDDDALRALAAQRNVPLYRLEELVSFYPHFRRSPPPKVSIHVCRDVSCAMADCGPLARRLKDALGHRDDVEIREVSCLGRCDAAPAVAVNDKALAPLTLADFDRILGFVENPETLPPDEPTTSPRSWKCDPYAMPADHHGTVRALVASGDVGSVCLERLAASQLRGMGGAGFPTGRKWELVARGPRTPKYVICNADESEPGTFKDRVILEELPHLVVEGMILAGLTVGAEQGVIFLRHEYARECRALERALQHARDLGVLGENAAGSGRPFDIEIFLSPGGYILGEETALLEALEDHRGEPRDKPPYPGTHGLWGQPTLINNVETFALATAIVHHGVEWWSAQGADGFSGLKFISISGDVERPGAYEVPRGIPVAELIERAGGMKDGKPLKAFLPGGASSNFLTADQIRTPLDFDAMKAAGSMLGTGAVIVMAENRDLFALATNLVRFFRNESCGKCVPCRVGTENAVEMLDGVQAGAVPKNQLNVLSELGETLEQTSICGLGQVALNPILSLLKHFPNEHSDQTRV